MLVLAAEHQRSHFAHRGQGRELLVGQDVHLNLVVDEPIAFGLAELDEHSRQPQVVDLVIDVYVEISDTVEV